MAVWECGHPNAQNLAVLTPNPPKSIWRHGPSVMGLEEVCHDYNCHDPATLLPMCLAQTVENGTCSTCRDWKPEP